MSNQRETITESQLRDLYLNQGLTVAEISAQLNISPSTIRRRLTDLNIPARSRGPKGSRLLPHNEINEELLRDLYLEQKLSIPQIAEQCGWGRETIRLKMLEYGIPIRSFSQSTLIQHNTWDEYHDFSGELHEKAYLIGFCLGDLHVKREHTGSEVLRIYGSSTRIEQINLIASLFQPYGHVKISRKAKLAINGMFEDMIVCSVNLSFEFLLDYHKNHVPSWIFEKANIFLSFFGGLTDAEGSFHLTKDRNTIEKARFSIKHTDLQLLELCHRSLVSLGIRPASISKSYDAGRQTSKRGVFATKALWGFAIENKESVLRFVDLISPYIKHEKRHADMLRVRENVEWRNSQEFQDEANRKRVESNFKTNYLKKQNRN